MCEGEMTKSDKSDIQKDVEMLQVDEHDPKTFNKWPQHISAFITSLPMLTAALAITWIGPTILKLVENGYPITPDQVTLLSSFFQLGTIIAAIPAVFLSNIFGRKSTILFFAFVPMVLGNLCQILSMNLHVWYISRILGGVGAGLVFTALPIYLEEISTPETRGINQCYQVMQFAVGATLAYVVVPMFSIRDVAILSTLPLLISVAVSRYAVESPYFYVMTNQEEKAKKASKRLHNSIGNLTRPKVGNTSKAILTFVKGYKRQLGHILLVALAPAVSGFTAINTYSQVILSKSETIISTHAAGALLPVVSVVVNFIFFLFIEKIGYKKILVYSGISQAVPLVMLYLNFTDVGNPLVQNYIPLSSLLLSQVTSCGLYIVPFIYLGASFPTEHAVLASCFANLYIAFLGFSVLTVHNLIESVFWEGLPYLLYAVLGIVNALVIWKVVPEISGMTTEEIRALGKGSLRRLSINGIL